MRDKCIPTLDISAQLKTKVIAYLQKYWMCAHWLLAWIDPGRGSLLLRFFVTTNNSTERLWEFYLQFCCKFKMFKRVDYELNAILNFYGNLLRGTSFFEMLDLQDINMAKARTVWPSSRQHSSPPRALSLEPPPAPSRRPLPELQAHASIPLEPPRCPPPLAAPFGRSVSERTCAIV